MKESKERLLANKKILIIIGPPTSGKTNQALHLQKTMNGFVLRGKDILPALAEQKESQRELVPDKVFVPALKRKLESLETPNIILENIPRTDRQAEAVANWAKKNHFALVVICLELSQDEVISRSQNRFECPECRETYHDQLKPPINKGKCDRHAEIDLKRRPGDKPELLKKAYDRYISFQQSILDHFGSSAEIYKIPASGTVANTSERLDKVLNFI